MWRDRTWLGSMRVRILAVVILLLVASSIFSVLLLRAALIEQLEGEIAESLSREAEEFRLLSAGNDPRTGDPFAGDLQSIFDVYFAREVADEGESLFAFLDDDLYQSRRSQGAGDAEDLRGAAQFWLSLDVEERGTVDTDLGEAQYIAIPLDGSSQDGLFVIANFPAYERAEIEDALRLQIGIAFIALLIASGAGAILAGRVLTPLRALATTARTISDTDLTRRIPVRGRDEASLIASAFNDMLARLESVFEAQRRFLDDTSHELRTPLTAIRGHVELMGIDDTPDGRQETIDVVTDEIDRLTRMVDDLFLLARAEHPDFLRWAPINVPQFIDEVAIKLRPLTPVVVCQELDEDTVISGDRDRLTQAVMQLVANSLKHAGPLATIHLGARHDGTDVVLTVSDDGPGVPRDAADTLFDRSEQAAGAAHGGAGLGLAIVRAIATAHGGTARIPVTEHGATVELRLPGP